MKWLISVPIILLIIFSGYEVSRAPESPTREESRKTKNLPACRFLVFPRQNPAKTADAFAGLVEHLNRHVPGETVKFTTTADFAGFVTRYRARDAEVLFANPWHAIDAMKYGYRVVTMAGHAEDYHALLLVRKDAGIRETAQLKGRALAFSAPTAVIGAVMPQDHLHAQGLRLGLDYEARYVRTHESALENVRLGRVAAAGVPRSIWLGYEREHPSGAATLECLWASEPLVGNAVLVRDDVSPATVRDLCSALLAYPGPPPGERVADAEALLRFHVANDADYSVVRDLVTRFESKVRKIEEP